MLSTVFYREARWSGNAVRQKPETLASAQLQDLAQRSLLYSAGGMMALAAARHMRYIIAFVIFSTTSRDSRVVKRAYFVWHGASVDVRIGLYLSTQNNGPQRPNSFISMELHLSISAAFIPAGAVLSAF